MSILSLNAANVFNALSGASVSSILNSTLGPSYVIRSSDGETALEFSGMVSLAPAGRANITNAPVELGKYQSINKVREPNRIQCSIVVTGLSGYSGNLPNIFDLTLTSQSTALATIQNMLATANTYDIETPKETLESYDLTGWSYRVTAQSGVTMLTIMLDFQEVIQSMGVQLSGAQSSTKITSNSLTTGTTGVTSVANNASATTSTLDELSTSWSNLKKATGQLTSTVGSTIATSFQSGLDTVTQTAAEVAKSATDKSTSVIQNITSSIT